MSTKADPIVSFHFSLEIQGIVTGYFTEVSGLGSEHEVAEHKVVEAGGKAEVIKKIPGRLKWENIVCKRGITGNFDIWLWRQMIIDGKVEGARKSGSLIMYSEAFTPVAKWDFVRGWPMKCTGPTPKSDSNEVGLEELTITHEGITRVNVGGPSDA